MPYFSLNVSHPDELTEEAREAIERIRCMGYVMISQSVFLKGVNGDVQTLVEMFSELSGIGVIPYYLYHCQSKPHTHALGFVEELGREIVIVREVFEKLPGIARPKHVIDIEGQQHNSGVARGKVALPHYFHTGKFVDFDGREFHLKFYK